MVFHSAIEFSDCDEPFLRKLSESGQIIGRDANNQRAALAWDGDKVDFACASGGEGPVPTAVTQRARFTRVVIEKNRMMHDFATKLTLLSKILGIIRHAKCNNSLLARFQGRQAGWG